MTQDELAVMDGGKCIFMLRGVRPFLSDKYDLTKHPNYKYTADADKKYLFDMERYMKMCIRDRPHPHKLQDHRDPAALLLQKPQARRLRDDRHGRCV